MAPVSFVSGCADCPLCAALFVSLSESQRVCQHPDAEGGQRNVAKLDHGPPKKPPRWCPLRTSALVVRLAPKGEK